MSYGIRGNLREGEERKGEVGERQKWRAEGERLPRGLFGFVESGGADLHVNSVHEHLDLRAIIGFVISMEIGQTRLAEKAGTLVYV